MTPSAADERDPGSADIAEHRGGNLQPVFQSVVSTSFEKANHQERINERHERQEPPEVHEKDQARLAACLLMRAP